MSHMYRYKCVENAWKCEDVSLILVSLLCSAMNLDRFGVEVALPPGKSPPTREGTALSSLVIAISALNDRSHGVYESVGHMDV